MRKIILNVAVSLDGFIEGANGEYDWCFTDNDYGMEKFLQQTDIIFFGRKSYELFRSSFPDMWNDKKHFVFSNTLQQESTKAIVVNDDTVSTVHNIKNEEGKNIWLFGGASLATWFLKEGLIDEILLAVHPVLLGSGKPLFQMTDRRTWWKLQESKAYESGLVQNSYAIQRK